MPQDRPPQLVGNWWLQDNLGSGYSGSIYKAQNVHTGEVVALKVQDVNHECPTNRYERNIFPALQGGLGMPNLWSSGVAGKWDYLAIDLLGPSLDSLFRKSGKETMDLRSVCCIAMQLIARLEFMHSRGVLHRDIQLGNCTIGLPPNEETIYMIDFGFSKRFIDPYTRRHIPDSRKKRDFVGNYWFSSVRVHCQGRVPSRRDDLEAAALMFIHLLTPRGLSWTRNGVPKTDEAHDRLKEEKRKTRPEELCRGMPSEFEEFLRYCRRLKFQELPDYGKWIDEFRELAASEGFPDSDAFVWPPPKTKKAPRRSHLPPPEDIESVLNGLKNMDLGQRAVLGDRKNIENAILQAKEVAKRADSDKYITISSGSEDSDHTIPPPFVTPKAHKLNKLAKRTPDATDSLQLAELVKEFIAVMKSNSGRTLTKEGFGFLDALYKQLADPSVFVAPTRSGSNNKQSRELDPANVKLGVVARLRREVAFARNNKALAAMVDDFCKVTNRSAGRTITKDGFGFLEGLAARLPELA
ncbi:CK1/CK1 protein kinase [Mycena floridula]|nr:CK1/CK1 protein kinase [Mycena floridula]